MLLRDGSFHDFSAGYFSMTDCPRYGMAFTSSITRTGRFTSRKPSEYSNAASVPSGSGSGRKSPVSVLLSASSFLLSRSNRKRLEAPVRYEDPNRYRPSGENVKLSGESCTGSYEDLVCRLSCQQIGCLETTSRCVPDSSVSPPVIVRRPGTHRDRRNRKRKEAYRALSATLKVGFMRTRLESPLSCLTPQSAPSFSAKTSSPIRSLCAEQ